MQLAKIHTKLQSFNIATVILNISLIQLPLYICMNIDEPFIDM